MKQGLWRKLVCAVLCTGLCLGMGITVQAASIKTHIRVDGLLQTNMGIQPYAENGVTMIGTRDLAQAMDSVYAWNESEQTVTMRVGTKLIILTANSDIALINFNDAKMPVKAVLRDGQLVAPLRFVSEALGATVVWDGANKAVLIDTAQADFSVMRLPAQVVENQLLMKYDAAIEKLNTENGSLQDLVFNLEILEEDKEDLDDEVKKVFRHSNLRKNEWTMSVITLLREQKAMENQIRAMKINIQQIKDGNEQSLRSAIAAIEETHLDIYLLEQKIAQDEINLKNTELKLSLGLETEANVKAARLGVEQSKSNLQSLILKQESNHLALNNLLTAPQGRNVVITNYDPMKATPYDPDENAFVQAQFAVAPSVALKALERDTAEFTVYSYYDLLIKDEQDVREEEDKLTQNERKMENEKQSKIRAHEDAKAALDKKIRGSYNSLRQLEESHAALLIDLQKAADTYGNVVASYFAGVVTAQEIDQACMNILNVEISIQKNRLNYATATFVHQKP